MKVDVACFYTGLPGRFSIARFSPSGLATPELKLLAPSTGLLSAYKHGQLSWRQYSSECQWRSENAPILAV